MRRRLAAALVLALAALALVAARPAELPLARAILVLEPGTSLDTSDLAVPGVQQALVFDALGGAAVTAPPAVIADLARDPRVADVYDERRLVLHLWESVEQIGAQDLAHPSGDGSLPFVTGAGQTVAVIDTGVYAHPDLALNTTHRNLEFQYAGEGVFGPEEIDAFAEATQAHDLNDNWGHGTHVAGIVAGSGLLSQGRENHGVAPGAHVLSLKIADVHNGIVEDIGWERNALAALDYITRHADDTTFGERGITVSNNSWGLTENDPVFGPPRYDLVTAAIQGASDTGIVMVFAAGNDGPAEDTADDWTPDIAISVAAACKRSTRDAGCDPRGPKIATFSSRGDVVDLAAPGVAILSANAHASVVGPLGQLSGDYGDRTDEPVNRAAYTSAQGTSMAAPHVAGVVALLLEIAPDLTPAEVQEILVTTADHPADAADEPGDPRTWDTAWGWGMVDVREAAAEAYARTGAG